MTEQEVTDTTVTIYNIEKLRPETKPALRKEVFTDDDDEVETIEEDSDAETPTADSDLGTQAVGDEDTIQEESILQQKDEVEGDSEVILAT